ncbi:MAG: amidase domain-containing protein [Bacillaceae bacterium]
MKELSFLETELEKELMYLVGNIRSTSELNDEIKDVLQRKKKQFFQHRAKMVKGTVEAELVADIRIDDEQRATYLLTYEFLVKQANHFYLEERTEERMVWWKAGEGWHYEIQHPSTLPVVPAIEIVENEQERKGYSRLEAVKYAETWWNSTNPKYKRYDNDCTNFISQCLHAGGFPMKYTGSVKSGWWYRNHKFSYSWGVAHSLLYYLIGLKAGIRGKRMEDATQLKLGDLIFYDFEGDGRFDHSTIVVAKDANGQPLVNAHTMDSRNRYWTYEDSSRYTPHMKYRFISIVDG